MMTLMQHVNYEATITLSGLNIFGTNSDVAEALAKEGFKSITVTGSGKQRNCRGMWAQASKEIPETIEIKGKAKISDIKRV